MHEVEMDKSSMKSREVRQTFLLWLCIDLVEIDQRIVRISMVECTKHHKLMDDCQTRIKEECCFDTFWRKNDEDWNLDHLFASHQDVIKLKSNNNTRLLT